MSKVLCSAVPLFSKILSRENKSCLACFAWSLLGSKYVNGNETFWKLIKFSTYAGHCACWRHLPHCFLCLHNWEVKNRCGSSSQTLSLPQFLTSSSSYSIKSIIVFSQERKKIYTYLNINLISNWLLSEWTLGNRTQQNFPRALFSMAHPKPSRKEKEPKTSFGI